MRALTSAGVAEGAIESESQSIAPVQQYGNQDWTPEEKVERKFQVQQSWTVKTAAKNASRTLDLAVKAGANQSGQIDWTVADEDALQAKAAGLALARAKQIAEQMARGLNTGLGPLIYASNEAPARPHPAFAGTRHAHVRHGQGRSGRDRTAEHQRPQSNPFRGRIRGLCNPVDRFHCK